MSVDCNVSTLGCYQSHTLAPHVRHLVYDGSHVTIAVASVKRSSHWDTGRKFSTPDPIFKLAVVLVCQACVS